MSRTGNILVITYWPLTNALVTTYTLPYLRFIRRQQPPGHGIFLVTLTSAKERARDEFQQRVRELRSEGITSIDFSYRNFGLIFLLRSTGLFLKLAALIHQKRVTHIHCWCTPAGAIGYILSRITGRPLILDSFEPHAESMVETGTWSRKSLPFRILFRLEKLQCRHAWRIICAAPGMMAYAERRYGISRREEFVKPAGVDLSLFRRKAAVERATIGLPEDAVVCVYAGKFGGIYLEDETFSFFAVAARVFGEKFRVLLLTNHSEEEVRDYCAGASLDPGRVTRKFVPHAQVASFMASADFAICPVKPVPTKKYCSPIKNGEYWALGLPVVIPRDISADSGIIAAENAGAVLYDLSDEAYEAALLHIRSLLDEPGLRDRIRSLAVRHRNLADAQVVYRQIYG